MRCLALLTLVLLVVGCALGPRPPTQVAPSPTFTLPAATSFQPEPEVLILGRGAFQRGVRDATRRRWRDAVDAFRVSQRHVDHPITTYNLARALYELGRYDEVLSELAHFTQINSVAADDPLRARAERLRVAANARVATLVFTVSPRGAIVSIDGIDRGSVGMTREFTVLPGRHAVVLRAHDHTSVRQVLRVAPGDRYLATIALAEAARATPGGDTPRDRVHLAQRVGAQPPR